MNRFGTDRRGSYGLSADSGNFYRYIKPKKSEVISDLLQKKSQCLNNSLPSRQCLGGLFVMDLQRQDRHRFPKPDLNQELNFGLGQKKKLPCGPAFGYSLRADHGFSLSQQAQLPGL